MILGTTGRGKWSRGIFLGEEDDDEVEAAIVFVEVFEVDFAIKK